MIKIHWYDNKYTTGRTWTEVLEKWRTDAWNAHHSPAEFRKEVVRRANLWSGKKVSVKGSDEQFMRALAAAEMFVIVSDGSDEISKAI